jgi:hypothetical protein
LDELIVKGKLIALPDEIVFRIGHPQQRRFRKS